ncbi:hypothetical protein ACQZV8_14490 [Magnetococcales bacterium HHB-1]
MNSSTCTHSITEADVLKAQKRWGDGIVAIGKAYINKDAYKMVAEKHVDTLYSYDEGIVLFKPTKATIQQFRLTKEEALSYFVGGIIAEDKGFALQPWRAVRFENAGILINDHSAIAMGNYFFTDAKTEKEVKVEFTFGYVCDKHGKLRINVHHSAFPYNPT